MKIRATIEVDIPSLPNFLRSKDGHCVVSVKEFTKKELEAIGKEWTRQLIKKGKGKKI